MSLYFFINPHQNLFLKNKNKRKTYFFVDYKKKKKRRKGYSNMQLVQLINQTKKCLCYFNEDCYYYFYSYAYNVYTMLVCTSDSVHRK